MKKNEDKNKFHLRYSIVENNIMNNKKLFCSGLSEICVNIIGLTTITNAYLHSEL